jgi:hypothetical protein
MSDGQPQKKHKGGFIRGFGRTLLYGFLFLYVVAGANSSYMLIKRYMVRQESLDALPALIDKSVKQGHSDEVTRWVALRPLSETDKIVDIISPRSSTLGPSIFVEFAVREIRRHNREAALAWLQTGRFRMRFDALRCGYLNAPDVLDQMLEPFKMGSLQTLIDEKPELLKKAVRRAIDFDTKYPAHNSPQETCALIQRTSRIPATITPEKEWEFHRKILHKVTERYLDTPDRK